MNFIWSELNNVYELNKFWRFGQEKKVWQSQWEAAQIDKENHPSPFLSVEHLLW